MKRLGVRKYLKKCLASLFVVSFVFSGINFATFAESVSIGDVTYEFNTTDEGIVLYKVTSDRDITELELPEQLNGKFISKIMGYRDESGLHSAFQSLANLEEVVVPYGVVTIGTHAFRDCTKLRVVALPISLEVVDMCAFMNCSSLKCIYLPKRVERVKYNAFLGCARLEEVRVSYGATFDAEALAGNVHVAWY